MHQIYIERFIHGNEELPMTQKDELQAVADMLMLRQELKIESEKRKIRFPYMKE